MLEILSERHKNLRGLMNVSVIMSYLIQCDHASCQGKLAWIIWSNNEKYPVFDLLITSIHHLYLLPFICKIYTWTVGLCLDYCITGALCFGICFFLSGILYILFKFENMLVSLSTQILRHDIKYR